MWARIKQFPIEDNTLPVIVGGCDGTPDGDVLWPLTPGLSAPGDPLNRRRWKQVTFSTFWLTATGKGKTTFVINPHAHVGMSPGQQHDTSCKACSRFENNEVEKRLRALECLVWEPRFTDVFVRLLNPDTSARCDLFTFCFSSVLLWTQVRRRQDKSE